MRIAIVTNRFAPYVGGNETTMAAVGGALARRGHAVTVLTRRHDRALASRDALDGLTVERFRPSGDGVVGKWLVNAGTFLRLSFGGPAFDCILVSQCSATVFGPALANVIGGAPLVLLPIEQGELSGSISADSLAALPRSVRQAMGHLLQGVRRWAYGRAREMIVASAGIAREAAAFGFPRSNISVIPNPVDTRRFRPAASVERAELRAQFGLPQDAEVVTCVTRLVQGKGLLTLVETWQQVARDRPRALLVLVGGGPGPESPVDAEQSVRDAVCAADLEQRVVLAGNRSDVERWLQVSDVFVFPSEREGFGNALVEAMACGLPVVCSRIDGAAADLVSEGQQGLKFTVGDVAGLAAAVGELLADEPARRRMGAAGLALVSERLALEPIAAGYEMVLRRAVEPS